MKLDTVIAMLATHFIMMGCAPRASEAEPHDNNRRPIPLGDTLACDWASSGSDKPIPLSPEDAIELENIQPGDQAVFLHQDGCGLRIAHDCKSISKYQATLMDVPFHATASAVVLAATDVDDGICEHAEFVIAEIFIGAIDDELSRLCCADVMSTAKNGFSSGCAMNKGYTLMRISEPHSYIGFREGRGFHPNDTAPVESRGMVPIEGGMWDGMEVPPFMIDRAEVSTSAYRECVDAGVCLPPYWSTADCNYNESSREDHPINCVDWCSAATYCAWTGRRLPSGQEWEWVSRGREQGRSYPWGTSDPTCELAVITEDLGGGQLSVGCGWDGTAPIGSRPAGASRDGVFDLAGNAAEWVDSGVGVQRGLYGGAWSEGKSAVRVDRYQYRPMWDESPMNGFRCAIDLP